MDIGEQLEQDQQKSSELHTLVETTKFQSATLQMQQSDKEEYLRALAAQICELRKQKQETDQRLNSDQVYIRRLHEYNYLKDAAF